MEKLFVIIIILNFFSAIVKLYLIRIE